MSYFASWDISPHVTFLYGEKGVQIKLCICVCVHEAVLCTSVNHCGTTMYVIHFSHPHCHTMVIYTLHD